MDQITKRVLPHHTRGKRPACRGHHPAFCCLPFVTCSTHCLAHSHVYALLSFCWYLLTALAALRAALMPVRDLLMCHVLIRRCLPQWLNADLHSSLTHCCCADALFQCFCDLRSNRPKDREFFKQHLAALKPHTYKGWVVSNWQSTMLSRAKH